MSRKLSQTQKEWSWYSEISYTLSPLTESKNLLVSKDRKTEISWSKELNWVKIHKAVILIRVSAVVAKQETRIQVIYGKSFEYVFWKRQQRALIICELTEEHQWCQAAVFQLYSNLDNWMSAWCQFPFIKKKLGFSFLHVSQLPLQMKNVVIKALITQLSFYHLSDF